MNQMAKAKTKEADIKSLPFKEREAKLMEMVNEAIRTTDVGLRPRLNNTPDGNIPVIASVDLQAQQTQNDGKEKAPVRS